MKLTDSCRVAIFCVFLTLPSFAQDAITTQSVQGTWKLNSLSIAGVPQKASGYMIFNGTHYVFITTRERKQFSAGIGGKSPDKLSDEEKNMYVDAFRNMTSAGGIFSITGNEISYVMEVVRTPNLEGQTEKRKSSFQNGDLVQDFIGGGQRQVYIWHRMDEQ